MLQRFVGDSRSPSLLGLMKWGRGRGAGGVMCLSSAVSGIMGFGVKGQVLNLLGSVCEVAFFFRVPALGVCSSPSRGPQSRAPWTVGMRGCLSYVGMLVYGW